MGLQVLCLLLVASAMASMDLPDFNDPLMSLNEAIDKNSLNNPPSLRLSSKPIGRVINAGESFELQCEAVGNPPPVFSWKKDGKPIVGSQDNNLFEKLRNIGRRTIETSVTISKIMIPCADKRHRGKYTCIVSNGYSTQHSDARISVVGTVDPEVCKKVSRPPQIIQHSESRFELMDNAVQLFCRPAYANQVSWYSPDRELLNDKPGFEVLANGDLMITTAAWDMMGIYTCVASNDDGETRAESFLYPTSPEDEVDLRA